MTRSPDAGMTVNERLVFGGRLGDWDEAVRTRDRARMIESSKRRCGSTSGPHGRQLPRQSRLLRIRGIPFRPGPQTRLISSPPGVRRKYAPPDHARGVSSRLPGYKALQSSRRRMAGRLRETGPGLSRWWSTADGTISFARGRRSLGPIHGTAQPRARFR